jgi:uncharacterized protein DUF4340
MKRLGILAAVFLVLALALVVQRIQRRQIVVSAPAETLKVDADRVTRLRIERHGEKPVVLERVAGSWKITSPVEYRANEQAVTAVLDALKSLQLEDVISTNPKNQGTYQVDSMGTRVQAQEGDKTVLEIVVGKNTPDFGHTYVRPASSQEVYRAVGVLTYNFNKRPDDWRDKAILSVNPGNVDKVVLEYPKEKKQVVVARVDSTWTVAADGKPPEKADSTSASQLVNSVAKLTTANFATPEEAAAADFTQPTFRLSVEADGGPQTVDFVEVDENKVYARKAGDTTTYQLYKPSLNLLMKKPEDLKPKPPGSAPSMPPSGMPPQMPFKPETAKPGGGKAAKPTAAQPAAAKPAAAKPAAAKPADAKPPDAGTKPGEARPPEAKSTDAKPGEAKPPEPKPGEAQPKPKAP